MQSCNVIGGMAADGLDLERNGKLNGVGDRDRTGSGLKSGV